MDARKQKHSHMNIGNWYKITQEEVRMDYLLNHVEIINYLPESKINLALSYYKQRQILYWLMT